MYIDQSGRQIDGYPPYTGPTWGYVTPFSFERGVDTEASGNATAALDREVSGGDWELPGVYYDPGAPPYFGADSPTHEAYVSNFTHVAWWSGRLDWRDGVEWDVSPAALGNIVDFQFEWERGNVARGHRINPATQKPYEPSICYRGDYTRVLAEFWAVQ